MSSEHWDILDAEGQLTGRRAQRGVPLAKGEYHLVVHIYLVNRQGEFLLQKRSLTKTVWPGRTPGAARSARSRRNSGSS